MRTPGFAHGVAVMAIVAVFSSLSASAQPAPVPLQPPTNVQISAHQVAFQLGAEHITIGLAAPGVVHVQAVPQGEADKPTLVVDPKVAGSMDATGTVESSSAVVHLADTQLTATWNRQGMVLGIENAQHAHLINLDLAPLAEGRVELTHAANQNFYGIGGYTIRESTAAGIVRDGYRIASAGTQGHSGAPFVWTTSGYGVLVDSNGALFHLTPQQIVVNGLSKLATDVYLMVGNPKQVFSELAQVSGHAPMFPKWSMGFMNSQWGINQQELLQIIAEYRSRHIPINVFIMDYDWKAWGEDNYGEFRWNPEKFPAGPSGDLAQQLLKEGIHLGGIEKPRIFTDTAEGRYATKHNLWYPHSEVFLDYFAHKPVKELDFNNPETQAWFGSNAIKYGFDHGIAAWWNDEADVTRTNTNFLNMEKALYDAQRAQTNQRVWSINRNFWLGSQRYAYGMWSGDIKTGFKVMARQRARMLSAINDGEMWWGMDGGGFSGHPSDQNYARWIEFAAFVPIFRVHGTLDERRQPWIYGPIAEKAATDAIRLRYKLIPYIYSYAWNQHVSGVGLVRPLAFGWPRDPLVANDVAAWMFGKWLLVSPVVEKDQTSTTIYLPQGQWIEWFTGKQYQGGKSVTVATDNQTWSDIPLFIRQGAIIPTQRVLDYIGESPIKTVAVDVFPSQAATHFNYYDDDGNTYAYEEGSYYLQQLSTQQVADGVTFTIGSPKGTYNPALHDYLVKVHGIAAESVAAGGRHYPSMDALKNTTGRGWATGQDRYGKVTWIRVPARQPEIIRLAAPKG